MDNNSEGITTNKRIIGTYGSVLFLQNPIVPRAEIVILFSFTVALSV